MNINRYNYEEYFLLYTDNELSAAERQAVEQFVQKNPDLREELLLLTRATFKPDDNIIFNNKKFLMQAGPDKNFIHAKNCEELFILYSDDELTEAEKAGVERFVSDNPQYQQSFELMQSIKLLPDPALTFPGKRSLYRNETRTKPVVFAWWRMAVAAAVLLFTGIIWLNNPSSKPPKTTVKADNSLPKKESIAPGSTPDKIQDNSNVTDPGITVDTITAPVSSLAQTTRQLKAGKKQDVPATGVNQSEKDIADTNTGNNLPVNKNTLVAEQIKPIKPANSEVVTIIQSEPINSAIANNKINEPEGKNKPIMPPVEMKSDLITKDAYSGEVVLASSVSDENVILTNIPVDRKNSLRGLFRKASRLIDKTTSIKPAKKSGFTIGNIEIAFQ